MGGKLKPCPFCGGKNIKILPEEEAPHGRYWYAECKDCTARSAGFFECVDDYVDPEHVLDNIKSAVHCAVVAWNRRVDTGNISTEAKDA